MLLHVNYNEGTKEGIFTNKKILIFLGLILLIFSAVFSLAYYSYNATERIVTMDIRKNATSIAAAVAAFIEHDIDSYIKLSNVQDYETESYDKEYYKEMNLVFRNIKNDSKVSFIFTEKKVSDTEIAYIFDGEDPEGDFYSPIGTMDSMEEAELRAFDEGITASTNMVEDDYWGEFITGFAPIKDNKTGKVVGLVGVDYSVTFMERILGHIERMLYIIAFAIIIITSFILYKLINSKLPGFDTDHLTGLYSKSFNESMTKKLIRKSKKTGFVFSLIMMDIDYFKHINDVFGHNVGDKVIKFVAQSIKKSIRDTDYCSRFGGDEFVVLLPNTNLNTANIICNRIKENLSQIMQEIKAETKIDADITLSIGVVEWKEPMNDIDIFRYADEAMYLSKANGRNRISSYVEL